MEKDYFKDRPKESTMYSQIHINDEVLVCEKHAQTYAKSIEDLTYGKVTQILTKHDHPRGIKVKIKTLNAQEKVGRIVYIVTPGFRSCYEKEKE